MDSIEIPEDDFIHRKYDTIGSNEANNLLLILSTPRSGSTLLCELLLQNNACIAHEYFQPYHYMSILAKRWGVGIDDKNGYSSFVTKLREKRTYLNGWLGVNIHSEHLPIYLQAEQNLKDLKIYYVHILRRDLIAQAISYHIAMQTGQWTSKFKKRTNASYDYNSILKKLEWITQGNVAIQALMQSRRVEPVTLYYEDLVNNTRDELCRLPCIETDSPSCGGQLARQAGKENRAFIDCFAREYFSKYSMNIEHRLSFVLNTNQ